MAEAKPTASLSSGLLARKGAARPAMRRQGLGGHVASTHDDLGWNDMGHDPELDDSEAHAAHVAEIMPMLSPMGAKPVVAETQSEAPLAAEADSADDANEASEPEARADSETPEDNAPARSPLSVKPGKPPVVLQREALEDRVSAPTPLDRAASDDVDNDPVAEDAEPTIDASAPAEELQPEPNIPVIADMAPAAPRPAPRKSAKSQPVKSRTTKSRTRRTARTSGVKAAFTLRIDPDRHLRLRLASAVTNLSAQQILIDAFDQYLKTIPEVETLAGNVARRNTDRS